MRASRRREVTASGESHHPNSIGGQAEVLRAGADEANGALGVAELNRVMVARPESVLEDESGHARRVEQVRDLPSFVVGRERAVAAAWRDDDRSARRLARPVDRQGRPISILLTERARRAVRPQEDRFWLGVGIGLGLRSHGRGSLRMKPPGTGRPGKSDRRRHENDRTPHESPDPQPERFAPESNHSACGRGKAMTENGACAKMASRWTCSWIHTDQHLTEDQEIRRS